MTIMTMFGEGNIPGSIAGILHNTPLSLFSFIFIVIVVMRWTNPRFLCEFRR